VDTPERHAEIARRAYAIWEREGRPNGGELDHWLRAEAELAAPPRADIPKVPSARPRRSKTRRAEHTA
jgi:hypothetical protein